MKLKNILKKFGSISFLFKLRGAFQEIIFQKEAKTSYDSPIQKKIKGRN